MAGGRPASMLAGVLLAGSVLAGCGASRAAPHVSGGAPPDRPRLAPPPLPRAGTAASAPCRVEAALRPARSRSFAAAVRRAAAIRSRPDGGRVLARVGRTDLN